MTGCKSGGSIKIKRVNKTMNNRIKRRTMKRRTMKRRTMKRKTMKLKNNRKRNTISRNRKTNKNRTTGGSGYMDRYRQYKLDKKIKELNKLESEIQDTGIEDKWSEETVGKRGVYYIPEKPGLFNKTPVEHQDFYAISDYYKEREKRTDDIGNKRIRVKKLREEIKNLRKILPKGPTTEESAADTEESFTVPTQVSQ